MRAVAQLAECYFELWREARDPKEKAALRCECDAVEGYFTERFSGVNPKWTRAAGDDVLRMAGREMTTGSRAQSQHLYDMYFKLYPTHYNAAQMAMSLGTAAYKAEDYAQAIHYYDTVLTQYSNSTHRANALKMNSVCYGKLGEEAKQIEYLKLYLGEAKMAADLVQSRLSLATIERNRGLALYAEASTNTVEETAAELRKAAAVMVLSAVKDYRQTVKAAEAGLASPLSSSEDKEKMATSRDFALYLEGDTWQRLQQPIGKMDVKKFLELAAKCYSDYLEKSPKGKFAPQALVMLGTVYTAQGDAAKSKEAFARLAKDFPQSDEAKNSVPRFAKALMDMGRKAEAVEQYEQMVKTSGNYTASQFIAAGDALVDFKAYALPEGARTREGQAEREVHRGARADRRGEGTLRRGSQRRGARGARQVHREELEQRARGGCVPDAREGGLRGRAQGAREQPPHEVLQRGCGRRQEGAQLPQGS